MGARRERPPRRRAADERDELAPSYVEHGASPPLFGRAAPAMTTDPADDPCSRFAAGSTYHGEREESFGQT
jgi:hypothetical protein